LKKNFADDTISVPFCINDSESLIPSTRQRSAYPAASDFFKPKIHHMQKFLFLLLVPLSFLACKDSTPAPAPATGNDSAVAAAPITMPYVAEYSSNFVPGKQTDVLTVLNNYKAWETNDMKTLRATCWDSITMVFADGTSIMGTSDSLVKMAAKFRDSLSKVSLTFIAWTSNHSVDKNEDWVNVWYTEVDHHKNGKVDSTEYEDDNMMRNGKIAYTSSHAIHFKKK
jgi:hypothetical protein